MFSASIKFLLCGVDFGSMIALGLRSAMSNPNGLQSQKSCYCVDQVLRLPDHFQFFKGHFSFQEIRWTAFMVVRGVDKTCFCFRFSNQKC